MERGNYGSVTTRAAYLASAAPRRAIGIGTCRGNKKYSLSASSVWAAEEARPLDRRDATRRDPTQSDARTTRNRENGGSAHRSTIRPGSAVGFYRIRVATSRLSKAHDRGARFAEVARGPMGMLLAAWKLRRDANGGGGPPRRKARTALPNRVTRDSRRQFKLYSQPRNAFNTLLQKWPPRESIFSI